ncbi:hypothetical protein EVB95_008 [Rhizobium phage RHph_TM2_3B]|nr:hypothetical protein EVB95_008 [Rhizobium phage RHph_TM2_3B]
MVNKMFRDNVSKVLKPSSEWSVLKNVTVMDPDGWDRQNFEISWNELISEEEFDRRAMMSTVLFVRKDDVQSDIS